ncbi:conserved hypothetical protein [Gammaproteobacteria bacterium]
MIKLEGFDIRVVPEKIDRGISIIIFANSGVGKTTLASTLPKEETLILNSEAGLGPLLGKGHSVLDLCLAVGPKVSIADVLDKLLLALRSTEGHGIKYLVIDNMSEIVEQFLIEVTKKRGKDSPEKGEYGDSGFKIREWMHQFRDLTNLGINVIFNAWESVVDIQRTDGSVTTLILPMLGKSTAKQSCGIVDIVGHLEANEKTGVRRIRLGANDQYLTKCQFGGADTAEPADLKMLIDKIRGFDYGKGQ